MKYEFKDIERLYNLPFFDLIYKAHSIHRTNFNSNEIELCTLLSVKTGSCPEDCAYCPQSAHYKTGVEKEDILSVDEVISKAKEAKINGSIRFCIAAAWRSPPKIGLDKILHMIKSIKSLGLQTCATLGMLNDHQATELKNAGLDFYNHNLDTSPRYYEKIISTRTYQDRLNTLKAVAEAGINICSGGIIGMGESREDRIELLFQLANLPQILKTLSINRLIVIPGTPLANTTEIDNIEFIRTIAIARIIMPLSVIRLSAGRGEMTDEMQALCFFAGANSIFSCEKLLTTANTNVDSDKSLLKKLDLNVRDSSYA